MRRFLSLTTAFLVSIGLGGCYSEIEESRSSSPPAPAAETDASAAQPGGAAGRPATTSGGGRSTLGRAKESAKGTVRQLEERDRELQKQLGDE